MSRDPARLKLERASSRYTLRQFGYLGYMQVIWARRTFEIGAYGPAMEAFKELVASVGAPPEMMMFSTRVRRGEPQDVYISLPTSGFLPRFEGFEECPEPQFRRDEVTGLVFDPEAFRRKFGISGGIGG